MGPGGAMHLSSWQEHRRQAAEGVAPTTMCHHATAVCCGTRAARVHGRRHPAVTGVELECARLRTCGLEIETRTGFPVRLFDLRSHSLPLSSFLRPRHGVRLPGVGPRHDVVFRPGCDNFGELEA